MKNNFTDSKNEEIKNLSKYCKSCGNLIQSDIKICPFCGSTIEFFQEKPAIAERKNANFLLKNLIYLRLAFFLISIFIIISGIYIGAQINLDQTKAQNIYREYENILNANINISEIILNNALIALISFIPGVGLIFLFFTSYNMGVLFSALSTVFLINKLNLINSTLSSPTTWIEFAAYGLMSSEGLIIIFALLTKRLSIELRNILIILSVSISLIVISAIFQIMLVNLG